jgi:hypothetical protein
LFTLPAIALYLLLTRQNAASLTAGRYRDPLAEAAILIAKAIRRPQTESAVPKAIIHTVIMFDLCSAEQVQL